MTERDDEIDVRLARIGEATRGIRPPADFGARVMKALEPETQGIFVGGTLWTVGRRLVPIAALAAVAALVWAVRTDAAVEDALATSYDVTEVEW
jgi:hypothetical protein